MQQFSPALSSRDLQPQAFLPFSTAKPAPTVEVGHHTVSAISAPTWEAINQALLVSAQQAKLESGATVRIDSTVSAALMHEPSDSTLLWDAVQVMTAAAAGRTAAGRADATVARSPASG